MPCRPLPNKSKNRYKLTRMRATKKIVCVLGLLGLTMAAKHSLKQKLAERGNTLAQVEAGAEYVSGGSCGCGCPVLDNRCDRPLGTVPNPMCDTPALGEPPLGAGDGEFHPTQLTTVLSSNQQNVFEATPDQAFTAYDESACCSMENALHQSGANATKVRKFGIHGDICVTECIQYVENGCAEESSLGRSKKNSYHQENAIDTGLGGGEDNCTDFTLHVCAPGNVTHD